MEGEREVRERERERETVQLTTNISTISGARNDVDPEHAEQSTMKISYVEIIQPAATSATKLKIKSEVTMRKT